MTAEVPEGKFYYQGNLKTKEMPWEIKITYYLDGKEIAAKDLAGKSGNLEIRLNIRENKACDSSFLIIIFCRQRSFWIQNLHGNQGGRSYRGKCGI